MTACPEAETLAAFAEGRLSPPERAAVIDHVDQCDECVQILAALNETIANRPAGSGREPRTWWLAAAAVVAIAIVGLLVYRAQRSPIDRLIALAPRNARSSEARLSGGFPWAAYRGPLRAEDADADPQRMRLIGTAGEIVADADRSRSADAQQAAGVALIVIDKPLQAVDRLRASVEKAPNEAGAWSDLAAAQYDAALRLSRPSLLPEALVSVDRALRIDPRHAEARFNRALILERIGLSQEARAAWQRYLEVDNASPWAVEARARLAKLDTRSSAAPRDRTRAYAEAETLGRWAEAVQAHDDAGAQRELSSARAVGDALVQRDEDLLRDAVRAIDAGSSRDLLADAHSIYRRGRISYAKRQLEPALDDLAKSAELFAQGGSPMALVARYYAACVRFDRNDVAGARDALQALLTEAEARPRYAALGAQVRWELALSLMVDGDWSGALPLLEQSRNAFRKLDERDHLGSVESLLADTLLSLGRMDEAWAARVRAFELLSDDPRGDRLPVSITGAAQMEMRSGRLATARALLDIEHPDASEAVAADALVHAAMINAVLGDDDEAFRRASAAVNRLQDAAVRALEQTHLALAQAAAIVQSDPSRATEMLTRAIGNYHANGRAVYLPECYLLRARAALRQQRSGEASADLEEGIEVLERSRIRTGAVVGTGVLNAGVALFDDAIRLSADRGDADAAFAYAERSRMQLESSSTLRELQQRLVSSDAAVLEVSALPQELVAICITADDKGLARLPRGADPIEILRPFDAMLARAKELIVVGDRAADFAQCRPLIERMPVSIAMSASALQPMPPTQRGGSLLAIALPTGASNAGLPESTREIADVASLYANPVLIAPERATFAAFAGAAPNANVIHIAGHTQRQSDDAGTALVFAHERVTWSTIALRHLPRAPIVVLAACETLRPRVSPNVRSLTLGDGFLAAGASDVIGTLTPIADTDARDLFRTIHRRLAAGDDPAAAVRAAQLEAIHRGSDAWRSVALLTRCIKRERS